MVKITLFNEPSESRLIEMIETVEDLRDYELAYGYHDIMSEISELLKKVF